MAMSDIDVQKQIKQMMGFIEQEANEKVEEIDAKAEEEFNIEKGRLVQQQRLKIMEFYERKEKQVELQKKIQSSNLLNQARLRVLEAQQNHIQGVLADARKRLSQLSVSEPPRYDQLLKDLLTQAVYQMMEHKPDIRCRQADLPIVESHAKGAAGGLTQVTGKPCELIIDQNSFLAADSCGGVEVSARQGRIKVVNTLENRLVMIAAQMLPEIKIILFGVNPNRKFLD
uniref:EOG090X0F8Y n=1 Tax=Lynceus sp. MCZ IZ 141354 TaxID=1930659 RepID=A0A9N6WYZ3_9CRUS|nr:EOG090X0F8Y [Lynceus sp. MCZ IZ 141354]